MPQTGHDHVIRKKKTCQKDFNRDAISTLARHQTSWFTVQGAEKRALHFTGVDPGDPTADVMFAFAFARFHRKLVDRLRKKGLLPAILLHGGQLDASADESDEIHVEPPAYMDDFSCRSSATRLRICFHGLLWPRRSPTRLPGSTGLQLNVASNKTVAVVVFQGMGRQQVLEELAVDLSWTVSGPQPSRSRMASRSGWSARFGTWEHRLLVGQGEVRSSQVVVPPQERRTKPRARRS